MADQKPAAKPDEPKAATATPSAPAAPTPPPAAPEPPATPAAAAISEEERAELEAFRAEKARKAAAAAAAVNEDGTPNLNLDPRTDAFRTLSVDNQIRAHYLHARGTIQDYARLFHKTVEEVLEILDMADLANVETLGDQIGDDELAPSDAPNRRTGQVAKVPFSVN